jgi:hypothetical protein
MCLSRISVCLVALGMVSGCGEFERARFNYGEGVGNDTVLVIPFREGDRWYTESRRGEFVAEAFKTWVQMQEHTDPVAGDDVDQTIKKVRDWATDQITVEEWKKLTAGLGAKYVLVGDIEDLALKGPGNVGLLNPTVRASYRVINVETGRVALERRSFVVQFERARETGMPTLELGADTRDIENRLLVKLAEEIGQDLYGYYRDWW